MSIKTSTGLANHIAGIGSLRSAFNGSGKIIVYAADPEDIPESADSAVAGTAIWTITVNGDGSLLGFTAPASGQRALTKDAAQVWSGATDAGTASYYRLVVNGDLGEASATRLRIQGTVGNYAGVDMFMANPTLVVNSSPSAKVLTSFSLALPEG